MNFFTQQKEAAARITFAGEMVKALGLDFEKLYADGKTDVLAEHVSEAIQESATQAQAAIAKAGEAEKAKAKAEKAMSDAVSARDNVLSGVKSSLAAAGIDVEAADLEDPEKLKTVVGAKIDDKSGRKALTITGSRGIPEPVDDEAPGGTRPDTKSGDKPTSAYDVWAQKPEFQKRAVR